MGAELSRLIVDPIARVLTNFNETCFGTGCVLDSGCSKCCVLHMSTGARETTVEEEERTDGDIHGGLDSSE